MTNRDIDLIARAISDVKVRQGKSPLLRQVANSFVLHLSHANSRFNKKTFLEACGLGE